MTCNPFLILRFIRYGLGRPSQPGWAVFIVILANLAHASTALAADALPQGFGSGQIEKQIEGMPSTQAAPQSAQLPEAAKTQVTMKEQSFVLTGVLIEGATVFDSLDFLPLYKSYLGEKTTVDDLRKIADAITRKYHGAGYFLSHTFLPAQRIEFGIVRIRVIEGYISNLRISGEVNGSDSLLKKMLRPVMEQRPLRREVLDAAFQNLSALPGLSLHPYVRALPEQLGAYELELRAEQKRFAVGLSIDNHGSEYIGPVQGVLALQAFDLTGQHETYQLKVATTSETSELHYYDISTEWLLGVKGARLQFGAARTTSNPGSLLKPLDAYIENDRIRLGVLYPLRRTANESTTLGMALVSYRSRTDLFGIKRLEDHLNSVMLSYRHVYRPEEAVTHVMGLSLTQGLNIAGSKVLDTQTGPGVGRPDFGKMAINYAYMLVIKHRWELSALIDGQYAANALPGSERYSIGGAQFGRAYDPSEITGDHGLAGRLEMAFLQSNATRRWRISPYGFYDLGAVWQVHPQNSGGSASLASCGLGLRAASAGFSAYLEAGKPLTRAVASQGSDGKKARVFAGIAYRF